MTPGWKMFFDLSMFDIQWEHKGYSMCQILQNNNLSMSAFFYVRKDAKIEYASSNFTLYIYHME